MILTADLHVTKEEIRLLSCLNFLDYLKEQAIKLNDYDLAILGDIFNISNGIKNQMFVPFFMKLLELKKSGIRLYFIPGNHDTSNKDNTGTLIETFSAFGTFIQKSATININGVDYDFLAYTEDPEDIPNKSNILLTHLSIEGYWMGSNVIPQDKFDNYELVVSGHVHKYQEDGKFIFIGAPYSINKGEISYRHGYMVINGTDIKHYDYNDAPEYLTIKAEEFNSGIDYNNKMVTVQINTKVENFVKLRDILISKGALSVDPEFIKEEITDEAEHKVNADEGVIMSVAKYLEEIEAPQLNNDKLLECYKRVLEECKCK